MRSFFTPRQHLAPWSLLALLALALAACAPAVQTPTQAPAQPASQAYAMETAATRPQATVAPADPPTQAAPTEQVAPTEQAAGPALDNEFHPSDPATVSLATGRPQFVEFFAFW